MVFIAFAFLISIPVHEDTVCMVNHQNRHQHIHDNPGGGDSCKQAQDQSQAPEKFGGDRKESEDGRNSHLVGEEINRAAEPVAAEPSQHFLSAMQEKKDSQNQSQEGIN